ncbi:hypothetical protein IQ266_03265 [filamentous cyanobacterium LEGE 11480]|uniref:Type II secretion system protein GspE N-terminal domain-containing protein n=1 Tax=Romeriopsis navalis LEGE 11480 TaxID=2777977 RepID=A0A928VJB3_9CYAN|nr:hypothetical protein [Romeriopsis navalis]MBE9028778.1 hypothetical protein [Romeriopsis navalis LEGE 11480]
MASQFQDIDLQDVQFLMETAARIENPGNVTKRSYYRPDDPHSQFDAADDNDDPTMVMSASIDMHRAFPLINKVLPFEACLYHEILPLYIQGEELYLGMVDLEDTEAITYARRMLGFLKYQLVPQTISSETHHQILSAFLSQQEKLNNVPALPEHTTASLVIEREALANHAPESATVDEADIATRIFPGQAEAQPTTPPPQRADDQAAINALAEAPTVPGTLQLKPQDVLTNWDVVAQSRAAAAPPAAEPEVAVKPTFLIADDNPPALDNPPARPEPPSDTTSAGTPDQKAPAFKLPGSALPELVLQSPPSEVDWRTLSGGLFLQGLLIRMMASGIGRLFLVRKTAFGQVLWTENGKAKMVLEQVALDQFRGAIDELKQLTALPLQTVEQPVEVEIERFYQRQRILLRLRISPKETGEEATIQVLRGAALKFYQKHQVHNLRRDTHDIAQQLRHKVLELGKRSAPNEIDRTTLPEIDRTIESLEAQLIELKKLRYSLKGDNQPN